MKYAIDRIIEDIAVLENIKSGEIIEVNVKDLPKEIHEGSILIKNEDEFSIDLETEGKRRESLRERLERLKGNN